MGSLVIVHVAAAAILKPQWDVCTGRRCTAKASLLENGQWDVYTGRRSSAKEDVFGSSPDLLAGNEGPGWIG